MRELQQLCKAVRQHTDDGSVPAAQDTHGNKVETWTFKATESADRVQMIIYWLRPVVIYSSIRVNKLADKHLYLTKRLNAAD